MGGIGATLALGVLLYANAATVDDPEPEPEAPAEPTPAPEPQPPPQPQPQPQPPPQPPPPPAPAAANTGPAACPKCCLVAVEVGPRAGVSVNGDQWLFGGHVRSSIPCYGNFGFGPMLAVGLGGNHLTVRSSGRLDYTLWFDEAHTFAIAPAIGASVLFYTPVGRFASFCNRVQLEECAGYKVGTEVGGGVRYRMLSVDAFAGFHGLPVVTVMAALSFSLVAKEDR